MLAVVGPLLVQFVGDGAADVWKQAEKSGLVLKPPPAAAITGAAAAGTAATGIAVLLAGHSLPAGLVASIEQLWTTLSRQTYWLQIQSATRETITSLIDKAAAAGLSAEEAIASVTKQFAELSESRAKAIAETEVVGALNAGKSLACAAMRNLGHAVSIEWIAVDDDATREDHRALNGVAIEPGGTFDVGGEAAQYPGDPALSAKQRCGCRCATAAKWSESN